MDHSYSYLSQVESNLMLWKEVLDPQAVSDTLLVRLCRSLRCFICLLTSSISRTSMISPPSEDEWRESIRMMGGGRHRRGMVTGYKRHLSHQNVPISSLGDRQYALTPPPTTTTLPSHTHTETTHTAEDDLRVLEFFRVQFTQRS